VFNHTMNEQLLDILIRLQTDKSVVVYLYEQLFRSDYFALVDPNTTNDLYSFKFLTYDSHDGLRELPVFTKEEFILGLSNGAEIHAIPGNLLWVRLLDIVESGKLEVAIDPGQSHGIRINNQMILGMISMYTDQSHT
jgi:hypothetical protein